MKLLVTLLLCLYIASWYNSILEPICDGKIFLQGNKTIIVNCNNGQQVKLTAGKYIIHRD